MRKLIILNTIPLIGALIALLLVIVVLTNKAKNKAAKITLSIIIFMNAHNLLESYLFYNDMSWPGLGLSYLHYHLVGALFLLYAHQQFKIVLNLKLWGGLLITYTIFRLAILAPIDDNILASDVTLTPEVWGFIIDYFISVLLNIVLLLLAFLKLQNLQLAVDLTSKEAWDFKWLKNLLVISIALYIGILIVGIVSIFDDDQWLIYVKLESVFTSLFSLSLAYSTMKFPIFAIHGDFQDLSAETQKKYAKSSLTGDISENIWEEINSIMKEEKPYRNPDYRLNQLAARVKKSVHHVSQVINEKQGVSFSDFINQFRVNDAIDLLNSKRAKQVTILAISLEAGFNSKTAFYNTFKRVTGKTPTEFKREKETKLSASID